METEQNDVVDLTTLTHRVARISSDPIVDRIFFNKLGRSLEFEAGSPRNPGAPQDVPACVAEAILADKGLAPHFRVQPITEAPAAEGSPATEPATTADDASSRGRRRRGEQPPAG